MKREEGRAGRAITILGHVLFNAVVQFSIVTTRQPRTQVLGRSLGTRLTTNRYQRYTFSAILNTVYPCLNNFTGSSHLHVIEIKMESSSQSQLLKVNQGLKTSYEH